MKKLLIVGIAAVALVGLVRAELPRESGTTFVRDALKPYVADGRLPGAIAVLYNDGVQETACVGYADVAAKRPIALDDPYMQCSQTKGFCGVTVAKLVEDGKISLDDPVSKYLPEFKTLWVKVAETNDVITLAKAKNVLTVRMVMNHTGGFPFEIPAKQNSVPGGGWSGGMPIRSVAATAAAQPLLFEPGTREQYSNTGIDIGAAVVEAVTGKKWEVYLKETVLDPLGMKSTWFWPTDEQLSRQIEMYAAFKDKSAERWVQNGWQQRPYNDSHVFASAGAGLWTTVNDQLKFYKMLMNLGVGDNGARILKAETVKSILAVTTRPQSMGGYSLGLSAPKVDGENEWFGHGGAWGTSCMVNWHRKQLKLWAIQIGGGSGWAWSGDYNKAVDAFFKAKLDDAATKEYTGRTK